jgi:hypothetical protein
MYSCKCQGPCLPHCYSKNNNYLLFFMIGIILGMLLYHIKVQYSYYYEYENDDEL